MADLFSPTSFTFIYPEWLLAAIPLALLLPWLKEKSMKTGLIAPHLAKLLTNSNQNAKTQKWPLVLLGTAWLSAVIALAGPSWKKSEVPAFNLSGARVLVMDMSHSMYAIDTPPNRLTQARYKALDLLPGWKEGATGLVTYSRDAYTVSPLTEDSSTLASLIPYLSPEIMPYHGSNAAAGVNQAIELLKQSGFTTGDIVIITDGMSQQESDDVQALLKDEKFRTSILAVGTREGAPIKLPDGSMLEQNNNIVIAKLHLKPLAAITKSTGGILQTWQATNTDVNNIVRFTEKPLDAQSTEKQKAIQEKINGGFWLLIPLSMMAMLGFRRGVVLAAMMVILPPPPVFASAFKNADQIGYEQFSAGDYEQAAQSFSSPAWKGIAQYKAGDYQAAIDTLSPLKDPTSRYNLGNAYAQAGDLKKAESTYEDLLKTHPDFEDAKKNLDIVKQAQAQQQDQEQNQEKGDNQEQGENKEQGENQQEKQQGQDSNQENTSNSSDQNQQENGEQNPSEQSQEQSQGEEQDQQNSGNSQTQQESEDANSDQTSQSNTGEQSDPESQDDAQKASQGQEMSEQEEGDQQENKTEGMTGSDEEKGDEQESDNTSTVSKPSTETHQNVSHPVLKKLEQANYSTDTLIRNQLLLQAQQKEAPEQTENSW